MTEPNAGGPPAVGSAALPEPDPGSRVEDALQLLNDRPVDTHASDLLGLDAYAGALEYLIAGDIAATPFTVAIHAPWGAGKSSLARLVQARLRREELGRGAHLVCWFNAWDHLVADDPNGALVAAVARTASSGRSRWRRLTRPLPAALLEPAAQRHRRAIWILALLALIAAASGLAAWVAAGESTGTKAATALAAVLAGLAAWKAIDDGLLSVWSSLSGYVKDASGVAATGSLGGVKDRLRKLVRSATKPTLWFPKPRRLVVIVDDLDRCPADVALALSTTCAQLLSVEGLVVVLLGDLGALERQAAREFAAASESRADPEIGRRYVEKILQYRVDLPVPRPDQIDRLSTPDQLTARSTDPPRPRSNPRSIALVSDTLETWRTIRALDPSDQVMAAVLVLLLLGWVVGFATFVASLDSSPFSLSPALYILGLGVLLAVAVGVGRRFDSRVRTTQARFEGNVRAAITNELDGGVRDADAIAETVHAALEPRAAALWTTSSIVLLAANAVAARYVEAIVSDPRDPLGGFAARTRAFADDESNNPRQHKRLVNQMILAFLVADRRGMLTGSDDMPERIAKWSVLGTRWPDLRDEIRRQPEVFVAEEARLRASRASGTDEALVRFAKTDPSLGPVINELLTMSPPAGADR
jgi:hypothetical protein